MPTAPGGRHKHEPAINVPLCSGSGFRYGSHMLSRHESKAQSETSALGTCNTKLGVRGCLGDMATSMTSTSCPATVLASGLPSPVPPFSAPQPLQFSLWHTRSSGRNPKMSVLA